MNLSFDIDLAKTFSSNSQKARVLTENWVARNMYCPVCGRNHIIHFKANRPVADFYCDDCKSEFELKSRNGSLGKMINDGSYEKMIERINSLNNPDFFFMTYNNNMVTNLLLVPRFFFTPEIIMERKPLKEGARRAGWIGCNINISEIPDCGKIFIIKNNIIVNEQHVIKHYAHATKLKTDIVKNRGWLFDTIKCIDYIHAENFSLKDVYAFEDILKTKHPDNNYIKDKLRQQLQFLRDKGYIDFLGNGNYRKIKV